MTTDASGAQLLVAALLADHGSAGPYESYRRLRNSYPVLQTNSGVMVLSRDRDSAQRAARPQLRLVDLAIHAMIAIHAMTLVGALGRMLGRRPVAQRGVPVWWPEVVVEVLDDRAGLEADWSSDCGPGIPFVVGCPNDSMCPLFHGVPGGMQEMPTFLSQNCCSAWEMNSGPLSIRSTCGGPPHSASALPSSDDQPVARDGAFHDVEHRHTSVFVDH